MRFLTGIMDLYLITSLARDGLLFSRHRVARYYFCVFVLVVYVGHDKETWVR